MCVATVLAVLWSQSVVFMLGSGRRSSRQTKARTINIGGYHVSVNSLEEVIIISIQSVKESC